MVAYRKTFDNIIVQIITGPKYSDPKEFDLDFAAYNSFMVELININKSILSKSEYINLGFGWLSFLQKYNNTATFEDVTKPSLLKIESQLISKSGASSVILPTQRIEKPCRGCNKPNDLGVNSCWWCGIETPTK